MLYKLQLIYWMHHKSELVEYKKIKFSSCDIFTEKMLELVSFHNAITFNIKQ